jgi:pyrroloquinoline quinone biosynthesis protein B
MLVHVLGSAAGGGVPQWNCACTRCQAARTGRAPERLEAAIAISIDGGSCLLFNATTDVRRQIEREPALRPHNNRTTPISAIFLTDANIDHCAGLLCLRQAFDVSVYSTAAVRDALARQNIAFAPFGAPPRTWHDIENQTVRFQPSDGGESIAVSAIEVAGRMPAFAGGSAQAGAAVAYRIEADGGAKVVYAPIFAALDAALLSAIADADLALVDGTFFTDDEMIDQGLGQRTATSMGHLPIGGQDGSLAALSPLRSRHILYTHINNSNPMLEPGSPAHVAVARAGISVVDDGAIFDIRGNHVEVRAGA